VAWKTAVIDKSHSFLFGSTIIGTVVDESQALGKWLTAGTLAPPTQHR
jgi:hypothetical protein